MKVAIVTGGFDGIRTQLSFWRLQKELEEAIRLREVKVKALAEHDRKIERLRQALTERINKEVGQ